MSKILAVCMLSLGLAVSAPGLCGSADLPDQVPADFPFPEGVSFNTRVTYDSDSMWVFVDFNFTGDPDSLYARFKQYAQDRGFEIDKEKFTKQNGHRRLDAHKGPARSLIVGTNDDGFIQVVFQVPLRNL